MFLEMVCVVMGSKSRADVQSDSKTEAFSETIEATEHQVLRSPSAVLSVISLLSVN